MSKIEIDPLTEVPVSIDLYDYSEYCFNLEDPLSSFQKDFILSNFPMGTSIVKANFVRDERFPCPIKIQLLLPDSSSKVVFLKMDSFIGGIEKEAKLLPILHKLGLPVPKLIAGPVHDPSYPSLSPMIIIGLLPGTSLLSWCWDASIDDAKHSNKLVVEGVALLHNITDRVIAEGLDSFLPKKTLKAELMNIINRGGPWFDIPEFCHAIELLTPIINNLNAPLVFSNGDYNPGNFLINDGELSGLIDFSWACFEDPYIGFAKYLTYDWYPLNKAGIIEYYLETKKLTWKDFAPRLALRALWTLQRELAPFDEHEDYRNLQLDCLRKSVAYLKDE